MKSKVQDWSLELPYVGDRSGNLKIDERMYQRDVGHIRAFGELQGCNIQSKRLNSRFGIYC